MSDNPNAEIIAIGTEILLGEITDTNSVYIARSLRDIGVNLYYMTTVGDNQQRIADAIDLALNRAEIVITCGGLGPTVDDMTRQGVATATQRELVFHQSLFDQIADRFRSFGSKMTENNRQQAYLPDKAQVIENPVGTAPSFIVETERGVVVSLPGVPREMKYLMTASVIPYLLKKYRLGVIKARVLKTAGIGESSLDDLIGKDILSQSNPTVGLAAHQGSVDVRITVKAETLPEAENQLNEMETILRKRIGEYIFGIDEAKLIDIVQAFLNGQQFKLSILEAGINRAVIEQLKDSQTLSDTYQHDNPASVYEQFHIPSETLLQDAAKQVAEAIYKEGNCIAGIAILSYPDIDENADKQQGSALAIYTPAQTRSRAYGFGSQSTLAREWISSWTLSALWRMLKEQVGDVE